MSILSKIIDLFLPPRCVKCGKVLNHSDGLCEDCFNTINFISNPYCQRCGKPFADARSSKNLICGGCLQDRDSLFRLSRSAFEYDDNSRNLITSFKFMDKTENAKVLAKWLNLALKDIAKEGADLIVPVPLHYTRLIKRRYNQSALLAKELSKIAKIKVDYSSVIRSRKTRPQVEFSGVARLDNVKNAFDVKNVDKILDKRIILIDDVMTTGSTLSECARALKRAGAKSIDFLTVARVNK